MEANRNQKVVFLKEAIHHNEMTDEVEPKGEISEYLDSLNRKLYGGVDETRNVDKFRINWTSIEKKTRQ